MDVDVDNGDLCKSGQKSKTQVMSSIIGTRRFVLKMKKKSLLLMIIVSNI